MGNMAPPPGSVPLPEAGSVELGTVNLTKAFADAGAAPIVGAEATPAVSPAPRPAEGSESTPLPANLDPLVDIPNYGPVRVSTLLEGLESSGRLQVVQGEVTRLGEERGDLDRREAALDPVIRLAGLLESNPAFRTGVFDLLNGTDLAGGQALDPSDPGAAARFLHNIPKSEAQLLSDRLDATDATVQTFLQSRAVDTKTTIETEIKGSHPKIADPAFFARVQVRVNDEYGDRRGEFNEKAYRTIIESELHRSGARVAGEKDLILTALAEAGAGSQIIASTGRVSGESPTLVKPSAPGRKGFQETFAAAMTAET